FRDGTLEQTAARGFAHVVGILLEAEAPDGDAPSGELSAESREYFPRQHLFLGRVHLVHRLEKREDSARLLRGADERLHVFRETGAAVPRAGVQEMKADARVRSDAPAHVLDAR